MPGGMPKPSAGMSVPGSMRSVTFTIKNRICRSEEDPVG